MKYFVTGVAGFIGAAVAEKLCNDGHVVVGLDNLNDYYDPTLKLARLARIRHNNFSFIKADISNSPFMEELFSNNQFDVVIHLAAQAGVRYSLDNPLAYGQSNLIGFLNILEGCRHQKVSHLVYASSSSVYGLNKEVPFATNASVDHPVSLYAATKKANEVMAHSYSHLYGIPTTGLRFFTVYGPWGRPDMALFKFTKNIMNGEPIDIYNHGNLSRDFTYIDDIVEGVCRIQAKPPVKTADWSVEAGSPGSSSSPFRVFNIGNGHPVKLMDFVTQLQSKIGIEAKLNMMPMQPGDVHTTWADTKALETEIDFKPQTGIEEGIENFVTWYRDFYNK